MAVSYILSLVGEVGPPPSAPPPPPQPSLFHHPASDKDYIELYSNKLCCVCDLDDCVAEKTDSKVQTVLKLQVIKTAVVDQ